jgi:hypothetical protein
MVSAVAVREGRRAADCVAALTDPPRILTAVMPTRKRTSGAADLEAVREAASALLSARTKMRAYRVCAPKAAAKPR